MYKNVNTVSDEFFRTINRAYMKWELERASRLPHLSVCLSVGRSVAANTDSLNNLDLYMMFHDQS